MKNISPFPLEHPGKYQLKLVASISLSCLSNQIPSLIEEPYLQPLITVEINCYKRDILTKSFGYIHN